MQLGAKNVQNEAWILTDKRPGTAAQAIGLAEEIGLKYKIINLDYSAFSSLPNIFLSESLLRLTADSKKKILKSDYLPSHVISAGRRSAPIALYLKKESKSQTKIIQIMNPNLDFKKFDFVILPKHDEVSAEKFPNLITTIGALTRVDEKRLASESEKFPELKKNTKTKIALLVGGSSNKTKFTAESVKKLAKISSDLAKKMDATLLVLNSRRTGKELNEALKSELSGDVQFFDWEEVKEKNPYFAILNCADFFVITGDSVSMISECCSTGKPVYIFDEAEISSEKHRRFHEELVAQNYAKRFLGDSVLENFSPQKLCETARVAKLVSK
ncbi:MAG: mitochondrial fission ELM1 family protein [Proteobacteria bacterium]|nr:mitochondrial fission ELM1 family protein [Pseudomonadota bacterium]